MFVASFVLFLRLFYAGDGLDSPKTACFEMNFFALFWGQLVFGDHFIHALSLGTGWGMMALKIRAPAVLPRIIMSKNSKVLGSKCKPQRQAAAR